MPNLSSQQLAIKRILHRMSPQLLSELKKIVTRV